MAGPKVQPDEKKKSDAPPAATGVQRKGTVVVVAVSVVVAMLVAGVGSYLMFRPKHAKVARAADTTLSADPAAAPDAAVDDAPSSDAPAAGAKRAPPIYLDLSPSFVVNLEDDQTMRYLQVDIQIMTRNPLVLEGIKATLPRIRNTLLLLLGQQHVKDLTTRESKEALQKAALNQVQAVLRDETGSPGIEALYFTNFVIQ